MMHGNLLAAPATDGQMLPGGPPPIVFHNRAKGAGPLLEESPAWKRPLPRRVASSSSTSLLLRLSLLGSLLLQCLPVEEHPVDC